MLRLTDILLAGTLDTSDKPLAGKHLEQLQALALEALRYNTAKLPKKLATGQAAYKFSPDYCSLRLPASLIVMSQTAYDHFTPQQKKELQRFGTLLPVQIPTIEAIGGGSARCMLGEVF